MFSEEVAWVTGSSTGIGRAAAVALAERGCRVVVHYNRSGGEARKVVEGIKSSGGEAALVGGDVADAQEVERMVREIEDRYGRLDILVNNAGSLIERRTLEEMTEGPLGQGHGRKPEVRLPLLAGSPADDEAAGEG